MIRSMTGFGRASVEAGDVSLTVEVRTVNHRHVDTSVRMPRALTALESAVRKVTSGAIVRGKVDCSIQLGSDGKAPSAVEIDWPLAERYAAFASEWSERTGASASLDASVILTLPGVARVVERGIVEEELREPLLRGVGNALAEALRMREAEGAQIDADCRMRLATIEKLAGDVERSASEVTARVQDRLRTRIAQIQEETGIIDEGRLHHEVALAADRLDVTEEVVRLRSHVVQFRAALDGVQSDDTVGRRLDFLVQEMVRESNTIGSKAGEASVAHRAVDLKTELERIREQVQNVE